MTTVQTFGYWLALIGLVLIALGQPHSNRPPTSKAPAEVPADIAHRVAHNDLQQAKDRLLSKGYRLTPRKKAQEDVVEGWCIKDLAEARHAAHAHGRRDIRDLIERVLDSIDPYWRVRT